MNPLLASIAAPILILWNRVTSVLRYLRSHLKATLAVLATLFVVSAVYAVTRPVQPTYVTDTAKLGDLKQTVEAVGTVVSEKDLELQFSSSDVVAQVSVKEGDRVKAGQRLAALRSGTLSAGVASASASVQSAQAALRALEEGSRLEEIAIVEAGVMNKRAALDVARQTLANAEANVKTSTMQLELLRKEAEISLSGQVSAAGSSSAQHLATAKTVLGVIKGVFNANDVSDAVVKNAPAGYDTMMMNVNTTTTDLIAAQSQSIPSNYLDALQKLQRSRQLVSAAADISSRAYDILSSLAETAYFTNTSKETNKTTLATQKSNAQSALSGIDSTVKSLQDAAASYDSKIAAQKGEITSLQGTRDRANADISTYETSLRIDEAQLALKKAPARQTDIDSARARVHQAQADVARASAQFRDTILTAPMDGIVTKVNVKVGEIRPTTLPSITLLGNSPYRVEMFTSEVDIPKIFLGQTGSIVLDAFRGKPFALQVGEIDAAATDKDGVPKYRVKLDFLTVPEALKVGMTGDAEVITGERKDVVTVPSRAVVTNDEGKEIVRILKEDGTTVEERPVTTGMEGEGGAVEVNGVEEGEVVVVLIKQ